MSSADDQVPPQDTTSTETEPRRPRRPRPRHDFPETQAGKLWKALENPSGGPVNELPGGKYNSAGGKPKDYTWRDIFNFDLNKDKPAFRALKTSCARDALLVGIGLGGGVGGLRFILNGLSGMWRSCHYAVGTFCLASTAMYSWCESRRREEAKGMAAAVAGMKMLHDKKDREERERKLVLEVAKQKEEETRIKNKRWWKPWT